MELFHNANKYTHSLDHDVEDNTTYTHGENINHV